MTIFNSRFVRRIGALICSARGCGYSLLWRRGWSSVAAGAGILVAGGWRCGVCGLRSMVSSNAMAVILDEFPHMAERHLRWQEPSVSA